MAQWRWLSLVALFPNSDDHEVTDIMTTRIREHLSLVAGTNMARFAIGDYVVKTIVPDLLSIVGTFSYLLQQGESHLASYRECSRWPDVDVDIYYYPWPFVMKTEYALPVRVTARPAWIPDRSKAKKTMP